MKRIYLYFMLLLLAGCATAPKPSATTPEPTPDAGSTTVAAEAETPTPIPTPGPYHLGESAKTTLNTGIGVKAVVMSHDHRFVYSVNLEDMSVFEFDREKQKVTRKLRFVRHKGWGFNYTTKRKIHSFQEKPVEAHLTHNDRYLWLSLHNAGGIVIWDLKNGSTFVEDKPFKAAHLYDYVNVDEATGKPGKQMIKLLWIKTGKTPKVLTSTHDGHWLYVANWHSHSVSAIDISQDDPAAWTIAKTIKPFVIPRGMVVTPDDKWLIVTQMGSHYLTKVDIATQEIASSINIGSNPRHLVYDEPYLYVSLNQGAKLIKYDLLEEKVVAKADTARSPRTIALSKDNQYIFVVCYHANKLQVFKSDDLSKVAELKSVYHPVAVDVATLDDRIEAWVGNYSSGTIDVFSFKKVFDDNGEKKSDAIIDKQAAPAE